MSIIVLKKSAFNKENTTGKNVSLSLWRVGKKNEKRMQKRWSPFLNGRYHCNDLVLNGRAGFRCSPIREFCKQDDELSECINARAAVQNKELYYSHVNITEINVRIRTR